MANIQNVVNTIIEKDLYDSRIPKLTKDNIAEVGNAILKYQATTNNFISALVNKIAFTMVISKAYNNPLVELKKGAKPLGKDIEVAHINPAKATTYDIEKGAELLKVIYPDVASEYYRLNRQDQYEVSISRANIKHAFTSFEAMEELIEGIKGSLLSGDNIDEFVLMKALYSNGVKDGKLIYNSVMPKSEWEDVTKLSQNARGILGVLKNLSSAFKFPSESYNAYNELNKADIEAGTKTKRVTWAPLENQILLVRSDILNSIDLNVLAGVFNLTKAELETRIIEVDTFGPAVTTPEGTTEEIFAVVQDRAFTQVWEDMSEMTEFFNAKTLVYNFYWNHWQTMATSTLANGVALTFADTEVVGG